MKFRLSLRFTNEWFLFLSPAFIAVHGFVRFPEAIHWGDIVWLFLEFSFWSFLLAVVFSRFLYFRKAAVFSFSLVLFNALFGSIYEGLITKYPDSFFVRFSFLFAISLLLFVLLFLLLRKTKMTLHQAGRFLNVLFLVLISLELVLFVQNLAAEESQVLVTNPCTSCEKPDVYLIVTDGYAGKEQLSNYFGFDNTAFEDSLRSLGFDVIDSSFSNYSATSPSIASLLNMQYGSKEGEDAHVQKNRNNTTAFFQKMGYTIINNSIFKLDDQFPRQPIVYFKTGIGLIRNHTFMSYLAFMVRNSLSAGGVGSATEQLKAIKEESTFKEAIRDSLTLEVLKGEIGTKESSPKFVYTHLMMPHPPYLYNEKGQKLDIAATPEQQYLSFLRYTNGQLLKTVKAILQNAAKPPFIILLSDHGYRNDNLPEPTPYRFSNLAAVYLPSKKADIFYKGMSNVNIFRAVLNHQFRQNLPLLRDSTCY